jgi:hypothetical protein
VKNRKKTVKNRGKPWKTVKNLGNRGNREKLWKTMENHGKPWKPIGNQKTNLGKCPYVYS